MDNFETQRNFRRFIYSSRAIREYVFFPRTAFLILFCFLVKQNQAKGKLWILEGLKLSREGGILEFSIFEFAPRFILC